MAIGNARNALPIGCAAMPAERARPLTARSVLASTLLGTEPPRLPVSFLVRTGELFGLAEGTVRTALSRMAASGEVHTVGDGWYELSGELVERQGRQLASRAARTVEWSGHWLIAVVDVGARSAQQRTAFRAAMRRRRLAELRDGVWLRPDNLSTAAGEGDAGAGQCLWLRGAPLGVDGRDDHQLVSQLWDLGGWAEQARGLRRELAALVVELEAGSTEALAPGFVLSARVLRHFLADPLLPRELLPRDWPGAALRADYDRYDHAYRELLSRWTRADASDGA